jgi:hypothetical protein
MGQSVETQMRHVAGTRLVGRRWVAPWGVAPVTLAYIPLMNSPRKKGIPQCSPPSGNSIKEISVACKGKKKKPKGK